MALQECNETIAANADCETFRFAQVLSAGGLVVSEPCPDPRDEAEWAGLVDFIPLDRVGAHLKALLPKLGALAPARFNAFSSAFQPMEIMAKAKLPGLFEHLSRLA